MKLNNKGWGFSEMLTLMSLLIIFLGIAVFFIYRLYYNLEENNVIKNNVVENNKNEDNFYYSDLEYKLKNGTVKYINNYYNKEITEDVVITLKNLLDNKIITEIKDLKNDASCSGYTIIKYENELITYKPYLKCSNYITNGYQESLDE